MRSQERICLTPIDEFAPTMIQTRTTNYLATIRFFNNYLPVFCSLVHVSSLIFDIVKYLLYSSLFSHSKKQNTRSKHGTCNCRFLSQNVKILIAIDFGKG